jgi:hypothetical protein
MLLLQPCKLCLQVALIFVGHDTRQLINAMRLRKAVELGANIVLARLLRKPSERRSG